MKPGHAKNDLTPMRRYLAVAGRVIRIVLVAYLIVLLLMMWLEESFIFFPAKYPAGDWQPMDLQVEDAWFQSDDGVRLHGWFIEHPDPVATVLFCHGNAGNLSWRAPAMRTLRNRARVNVLIFDYRGYGRSEGKPSEQGLYADARAARRWLARRAGLAPEDIVMMGRSIGGAVAVELAAQDGARALILESTFTSLPDMAAQIYPFIPARWLMRNRFDSVEKIGAYAGPLLQSHGNADTIVPIEQGRRLFAAAENARPKRFIPLPGLDHNDPQPIEYYEALREFLDAERRHTED